MALSPVGWVGWLGLAGPGCAMAALQRAGLAGLPWLSWLVLISAWAWARLSRSLGLGERGEGGAMGRGSRPILSPRG